MKNVITLIMLLIGHLALCQKEDNGMAEKYKSIITWIGDYGNNNYAVDIVLTKKNVVEFRFESRSNKYSWLEQIDCSLSSIVIENNTLMAIGGTEKGDTAKIMIHKGECSEIKWIIEVTGERSDFDYPYYRSGAGILSN